MSNFDFKSKCYEKRQRVNIKENEYSSAKSEQYEKRQRVNIKENGYCSANLFLVPNNKVLCRVITYYQDSKGQTLYRMITYEQAINKQAFYRVVSCGKVPYGKAFNGKPLYEVVTYEQTINGKALYRMVTYEQDLKRQVSCRMDTSNKDPYGQAPYEQALYEQALCKVAIFEQVPYGQVLCRVVTYEQAPNGQVFCRVNTNVQLPNGQAHCKVVTYIQAPNGKVSINPNAIIDIKFYKERYNESIPFNKYEILHDKSNSLNKYVIPYDKNDSSPNEGNVQKMNMKIKIENLKYIHPEITSLVVFQINENKGKMIENIEEIFIYDIKNLTEVDIKLKTTQGEVEYKTKLSFMEGDKELLTLYVELETLKSVKNKAPIIKIKDMTYENCRKLELLREINVQKFVKIIELLNLEESNELLLKLKNCFRSGKNYNEIICKEKFEKKQKDITKQDITEQIKSIFHYIFDNNQLGLYLSCFKYIYDCIINNVNNTDHKHKSITGCFYKEDNVNKFIRKFNYGFTKINDIVILVDLESGKGLDHEDLQHSINKICGMKRNIDDNNGNIIRHTNKRFRF